MCVYIYIYILLDSAIDRDRGCPEGRRRRRRRRIYEGSPEGSPPPCHGSCLPRPPPVVPVGLCLWCL